MAKLITSSTHCRASNPIDEKGSEFMRRSMWWEAHSMPMAAYDPRLLREQETPVEIGNDWFLDQKIPAGGFVRILDVSRYGKNEWTKRESSQRKVCHCRQAQDEDGELLAGNKTF